MYGWTRDGHGRCNELLAEAFQQRPDLRYKFELVLKVGIRLDGGYRVSQQSPMPASTHTTIKVAHGPRQREVWLGWKGSWGRLSCCLAWVWQLDTSAAWLHDSLERHLQLFKRTHIDVVGSRTPPSPCRMQQ